MFELQPTLSGELLELRPLRTNDFDALYAVASDPLIWEQHPANDRYKEGVFREFFAKAMECGGAFMVFDVKDGSVIGSSRFYDYDNEKSEIKIGFTFLARPYWGGAYNREMKRLMLSHAFKFVDRVKFHVGEHNARSQRAMEKLGGIRVGFGRGSVIYEITASMFAKDSAGA